MRLARFLPSLLSLCFVFVLIPWVPALPLFPSAVASLMRKDKALRIPQGWRSGSRLSSGIGSVSRRKLGCLRLCQAYRRSGRLVVLLCFIGFLPAHTGLLGCSASVSLAPHPISPVRNNVPLLHPRGWFLYGVLRTYLQSRSLRIPAYWSRPLRSYDPYASLRDHNDLLGYLLSPY